MKVGRRAGGPRVPAPDELFLDRLRDDGLVLALDVFRLSQRWPHHLDGSGSRPGPGLETAEIELRITLALDLHPGDCHRCCEDEAHARRCEPWRSHPPVAADHHPSC